MKRTYIYPQTFHSILVGSICLVCLAAAVAARSSLTAVFILTATGLFSLCLCLYHYPIVSFDEQRIYILRLFPGTIKCIYWNEIRNISPLVKIGLNGPSCLIRTGNQKYTFTVFLKGLHKLLKYWDSIHSTSTTAPLKYEQLPIGIYRKTLRKALGVFILAFVLCLWLSLHVITKENQYFISIVGFTTLLILLLYLPFLACYFNYYEFTPTHFCIRSPFPFWNYKVRWENICGILQYSTKANWICICTKDYRYKHLIIGYHLPEEILVQLQSAGIFIQ